MSDEVPIIQVSFSEQEREAIKHFEAGFRKGLEKKCKKCEITLRSILRQLREKREEWAVPCGNPIMSRDGKYVNYGCCRPKGHEGPHETLEDRHAGKYRGLTRFTAEECADALLPIISEAESGARREIA